LSSIDARHQRFVASMSYRADRHGTVDLRRAQPIAGASYSGAWRMELLVSMTAVRSRSSYYDYGNTLRRFTLTVRTHGAEVARTTFMRGWLRGLFGRVVEPTVSANGFVGRYVAPTGTGRRPAVLVLGGSEGGIPGWIYPEEFASHGLPTLALGYFDAPGVPKRLVNIPLEYFERALAWLGRQPGVDPHRISVLGISYGSEAALLLGVHDPDRVHQVVALVPSAVVTCGIVGGGRSAPTPDGCLGSPWSLHGKPLAHTALINSPSPWDAPKAVIPVGDIRGRVFLVCAGADEDWSSCPYARAILERRRYERTTLFAFPHATHFVGSPFVDYPAALVDLVTSVTELDRERYYPQLLRFLGGR